MPLEQENIRVRIPGQIYARAFREKWLPTLAFYVYMCKSHSGKNYYFKNNHKTKMMKATAERYGISFTQFCKHIKILADNGLVHFHNNEMRLVSNRNLLKGKCKYIFVPAHISQYKDIKIFLNTIPILSNIVKQERAVERIKRYNYISERVANGNTSVSGRDYRSLATYQKKGGKMNYNAQTFLSIKRISELVEKTSKQIVIKYKKFLREKGLVRICNEFLRAYPYKVSQRIFFMMKNAGEFSTNFFWHKGYIYESSPSCIQVAYR